MSDRITLTSPGDVVAAVPALLGFRPERSLVVLCTTVPAGTLVCTVRLDLDTPTVEITRRLLDLAARVGPGRLLLVAYPLSLPEWIDSVEEGNVLDAVDTITDAGTPVADLLVVAGGRFYSQMCTDPGCCPVEGRPVPAVTTVMEAERVRDGHPAAATSRHEVVARYALTPALTPSSALIDEATNSAPASLGEACQHALEALRSLTTRSCLQADARALATVLVALQDVNVRDWTLAQLATDPIDHALVDALVRAALAAPDDLRPRVAGAAAAVLFAVGDNPVAVWAMLDHAGADSLAQLVLAGIDVCTPPTVLREVFAEARKVIQARIDAGDPVVA